MVSYSRIPNVDNETGEEFSELTFSEFDNNDDLRLVERRRTRTCILDFRGEKTSQLMKRLK